MKLIKPTLKKPVKFLTFLVAIFLSVQAMRAASPSGLPQIPSCFNPAFSQLDDQAPVSSSEQIDISCTQAWQNLQDAMANLAATPSPQDLGNAEARITIYQGALVQARGQKLGENEQNDAVALASDLCEIDFSNPIEYPYNSVEFGSFEDELFCARVGVLDNMKISFFDAFNNESTSLMQDAAEKFIILQTDLLNVDASNPLALDQINKEMGDYSQVLEKLAEQSHRYKESELKDAVNRAALSTEEQQLWNQFQSVLTKKCQAACENYFNQLPSNEGVTDPVQMQNNLERTQEINAFAGVFKFLEQGCLYEFLNVLLSKRSDKDSSLNSFHQLQGRLDQFLNNVDVNNPVAALQAQVDMLAYEREVSGL